jgi:hypothetical protein
VQIIWYFFQVPPLLFLELHFLSQRNNCHSKRKKRIMSECVCLCVCVPVCLWMVFALQKLIRSHCVWYEPTARNAYLSLTLFLSPSLTHTHTLTHTHKYSHSFFSILLDSFANYSQPFRNFVCIRRGSCLRVTVIKLMNEKRVLGYF